MKILMASETYPPDVNGAAIATERLAKGLKKNGHVVTVVASAQSLKYIEERKSTITVYRLPSILINKAQKFRISPALFHASKFRKIIEKVKPDIIHINNPGFITHTAVNQAKKYNIPIIGTGHFMAENFTHYFHLPNLAGEKLNAGIWKIYAQFYQKLNLVIAPTSTTAALLKKAKVGTDIVIISNGIDLKKFTSKGNGDYLKKKLNLPKKPTLLFLGRLEKEKRIDSLLGALAKIKEKSDFNLIVSGKGTEEEALKKLASDLGIASRTTFTGYLPEEDLPNIYKIADIFVIPGIAELQSLVTMEAMASGLPVVGANAVALPHLIKDGKNGFLFEAENEVDLANKLLLLLKNGNLRKKMGKESLKIIKEHDINTVVKKVEDLCLKVIKNYEANIKKETS